MADKMRANVVESIFAEAEEATIMLNVCLYRQVPLAIMFENNAYYMVRIVNITV